MSNPTWGYKLEKGEVISRIFEDGKLPTGWKDTPAKLKGGKDAEV